MGVLCCLQHYILLEERRQRMCEVRVILPPPSVVSNILYSCGVSGSTAVLLQPLPLRLMLSGSIDCISMKHLQRQQAIRAFRKRKRPQPLQHGKLPLLQHTYAASISVRVVDENTLTRLHDREVLSSFVVLHLYLSRMRKPHQSIKPITSRQTGEHTLGSYRTSVYSNNSPPRFQEHVAYASRSLLYCGETPRLKKLTAATKVSY